ncbi:high ligh-induced protein family [Synechococcus sp. RS9909]|uniref:photosystem II assembly protein Psb34 n=1 Tax=unclassified Synechococcus TaxID=2626047 RepID=UPI000564C3B4|nr:MULTISPECIES: ssl1498 family light-harvesting-like protein [unclassified Synechococcus]QNI78072.1 high ligh-induced protein family [Synechococcus sp. RS9909]
MQVTQEDGGRLNAFAKEPRMEVMDASASRSNGSRLLILGGTVLVLSLMAISAAIS